MEILELKTMRYKIFTDNDDLKTVHGSRDVTDFHHFSINPDGSLWWLHHTCGGGWKPATIEDKFSVFNLETGEAIPLTGSGDEYHDIFELPNNTQT